MKKWGNRTSQWGQETWEDLGYCEGLTLQRGGKGKGKGSSLDIAPLTILDSGALQPRKWQLTSIDCSTAAQASGCP